MTKFVIQSWSNFHRVAIDPHTNAYTIHLLHPDQPDLLHPTPMILITHATNFLSTQLMRTLNQHNFKYLAAVAECRLNDFLSRPFLSPLGDTPPLHIQQWLTNNMLPDWLEEHYPEVEFIFHLDTHESVLSSNALFHSLWEYGSHHQIPFIFRTTPTRAAWVAQQASAPFFWAGLSFADAFGPGDEGWVPQAYQALSRGVPPLDRPSEARAMVYGSDVAAACYFLVHHRTHAGFHTLATEAAVTYPQVADWVEQATKGNASAPPLASAPTSLRTLGFDQPFFSHEAGVYDYVQNHLMG